MSSVSVSHETLLALYTASVGCFVGWNSSVAVVAIQRADGEPWDAGLGIRG